MGNPEQDTVPVVEEHCAPEFSTKRRFNRRYLICLLGFVGLLLLLVGVTLIVLYSYGVIEAAHPPETTMHRHREVDWESGEDDVESTIYLQVKFITSSVMKDGVKIDAQFLSDYNQNVQAIRTSEDVCMLRQLDHSWEDAVAEQQSDEKIAVTPRYLVHLDQNVDVRVLRILAGTGAAIHCTNANISWLVSPTTEEQVRIDQYLESKAPEQEEGSTLTPRQGVSCTHLGLGVHSCELH